MASPRKRPEIRRTLTPSLQTRICNAPSALGSFLIASGAVLGAISPGLMQFPLKLEHRLGIPIVVIFL